jgi:uncharacterized protein YabE (DUF348 family)
VKVLCSPNDGEFGVVIKQMINPLSRIKVFKTRYIHGKNLKWLKIKNHPFLVPVATFLVLFVVSLVAIVGFSSRTIKSNNARVVIVSYDKKQQIVPTTANTVGELLTRLEVQISEGDIVEPDQNTPIVEDNFRVNVYRARPVTIVDEGRSKLAFSAATTPRSIAAQAGVEVFAEDKIVTKPVENVLVEGIAERVVIDRALPVNINIYGTPASTRTHATTVGELLREKNIQLAEGDAVNLVESTSLTAGMQIFVTRSGTQIVTAEEVIEPEQQVIEDRTLSFGTTVVRQQGSPGKRLVTYQIDTINGQEVGRKQIQTVVVVESVKRIVARGNAISIPEDKTIIMAAAGIPADEYPYVNYIISNESGWCATKWQGQIGYCPAYYQELHALDSGFGYGLCQSTPAIKMASAGADWQTNPVTQLKWCYGYMVGYGSAKAAMEFKSCLGSCYSPKTNRTYQKVTTWF